MSNSDSVEQRVIEFIANYINNSSAAIDSSTTLESLGIISEDDTVELIMELEDSFGIVYTDGDANGLVTVGDVIALIENKLGV